MINKQKVLGVLIFTPFILAVIAITVFSQPNFKRLVSTHKQAVLQQPTQNQSELNSLAQPRLQVYHNRFFGYQIRFHNPLEVRPVRNDYYGVNYDDRAVLEVQPSVEISPPQEDGLQINVIRNDKNYHLEQWVDDTIKQYKENVIKAEQNLTIQNRPAYSIEFKGIYNNLPSSTKLIDSSATAGTFYKFVFIQDGDRIIRVSFPTVDPENCGDCYIYSDVFSTFTFTN
jgi:hypothetical protein